MISVTADFFMSLNPYVVISAYLPLLAGLAVLISFYIRFDRNILKKLEWTFLRLANSADGFTKCKLENLKAMNEVAEDMTTPQFEAAWKRMLLQVEHRYSEEIIPEAECFFRKDALIIVPAHRSSLKTLWGVTMALMLLSVLLPSVTAVLFQIHVPGSIAVVGLVPAALILIVLLIFSALDRSAINKTMAAYHRFLYGFDTVLPTAAEMAGPALLLDATRKNQRSFEKLSGEIIDSFTKNTEKISGAIDEFANGGVLPAIRDTMQTLTADFIVPATQDIRNRLDETLKTVTERQDTGMHQLAESFASKLADTLEYRMNMIADALSQYQYRMEEQNTLYQDRISELNDLLTKNMRGLADFMEKQNNSMGRSEEILYRAVGLYQSEAENAARFNENLDGLHQLADIIREQTEKFAGEALQFSEKSAQAQQNFGTLVTGVTGMMQEALAGAGREIASGVNQAVGDNAQAIADLTVQAQALREDYETFFTRSDESTKQTLEEMDYQIQGLITRMSEDVGSILKTSTDKNGEILAQYKDQTADILRSFDEQARSIGLYAKEMNMDIAVLAENLGASVANFNEKIREGIQLSISEFDSGLAELTDRIANTVESITDAVENLPASIRMGDTGRQR